MTSTPTSVPALPHTAPGRITRTAMLVALGMALPALSAWAQSSGPDAIDVTESALMGTVACNGGAPTQIASVDASTTDVSGSNDQKASSLSASACGLPLYTIGSADDATQASDTSSQDDGDGSSSLQNVSILNGVLTFTSKTETDACNVTDGSGDLTCNDNTTVQNLYFGGQHIVGNFTQPTTFYATNLRVQVPGACTGVAAFSGELTVASSSTQGQGTGNATETIVPINLDGTMTCVGLPLTSMKIDLEDMYTANSLLLLAPAKLPHTITPNMKFSSSVQMLAL